MPGAATTNSIPNTLPMDAFAVVLLTRGFANFSHSLFNYPMAAHFCEMCPHSKTWNFTDLKCPPPATMLFLQTWQINWRFHNLNFLPLPAPVVEFFTIEGELDSCCSQSFLLSDIAQCLVASEVEMSAVAGKFVAYSDIAEYRVASTGVCKPIRAYVVAAPTLKCHGEVRWARNFGKVAPICVYISFYISVVSCVMQTGKRLQYIRTCVSLCDTTMGLLGHGWLHLHRAK